LNPSFIESRLPWKPDLWLQIDAGWWLQRPEYGIVAHIATDPHVLDYDKQREQCDLFFNMQRSYMKEGDIHLPYAFDPTVHRPLDIKKEYDGCLVGLQYETRTQLVRALIGAGYDIEYSIGAVYDEFNVLYNKSRIALNWSSLLDLNARTFEAMGMGIPLLTNRIPALDEFFEEGQHYLGFDTVPEAVEQFTYLIDDYTYADYLALCAYEEVIEKHTYDHRIQQILDTVFE
jgi:glycosyltransferase involved in cell wall biosynthesis